MIAEALEDRQVAKKKAGHGGKRPGAGRPSSGRDDTSVKLDRTLARKARMIAEARDISVGEYLSETFRATLNREYAKLMRELEENPEQ